DAAPGGGVPDLHACPTSDRRHEAAGVRVTGAAEPAAAARAHRDRRALDVQREVVRARTGEVERVLGAQAPGVAHAAAVVGDVAAAGGPGDDHAVAGAGAQRAGGDPAPR